MRIEVIFYLNILKLFIYYKKKFLGDYKKILINLIVVIINLLN